MRDHGELPALVGLPCGPAKPQSSRQPSLGPWGLRMQPSLEKVLCRPSISLKPSGEEAQELQ